MSAVEVTLAVSLVALAASGLWSIARLNNRIDILQDKIQELQGELVVLEAETPVNVTAIAVVRASLAAADAEKHQR